MASGNSFNIGQTPRNNNNNKNKNNNNNNNNKDTNSIYNSNSNVTSSTSKTIRWLFVFLLVIVAIVAIIYGVYSLVNDDDDKHKTGKVIDTDNKSDGTQGDDNNNGLATHWYVVIITVIVLLLGYVMHIRTISQQQIEALKKQKNKSNKRELVDFTLEHQGIITNMGLNLANMFKDKKTRELLEQAKKRLYLDPINRD